MELGWCCAVCGARRGVDAVAPWRCPRATAADPHHVLHLDDRRDPAGVAEIDDPHPFVRFGPRLAWWAFARARGMSTGVCAELTREVADGVHVSPYGVSEVLSDELGLEVWVKDETGQVAGSHKVRHLVSILAHLRAAEELGLLRGRPTLAIASCGNAALAAATLARGVGWPLRVFVPEWMDEATGARLAALGAEVERCPRRSGDPPGDPALHRFRAAVTAGAVPFSVQGPENALCLDGGRTLGWEMVEAAGPDRRPRRVFVQVGGGALASCMGTALGPATTLHAVQAEGCAPLARAWDRARHLADPGRHWAEVMTPWADPTSLADGILDDETYDWLGVLAAMQASGGSPVVAPETHVVKARALAHRAGFDASATGSAGLAGLVWGRAEVADGERVAVVMSGRSR